MKANQMKSNSKKKKSTAKKTINKEYKSIKDLNISASKIIEWNKKGIGLSVDLQKSLKKFKDELSTNSSFSFIKAFEEESIIQEMYEWYSKSALQSQFDNNGLEEIFNIVEAFFDRLRNDFNFNVIEEPGVIIPSPTRYSKKYLFENKYSPELKFAKVLKCGLKSGKRIISPCIVLQTDNSD